MDIRRVACDSRERERTDGDILLLLIRLSYWQKKQQAVIIGRASKIERISRKTIRVSIYMLGSWQLKCGW